MAKSSVGKWIDEKLKKLVKEDRDWAIRVAKKSGYPGIHDGPADAFRHLIGTAAIVKRFGVEVAIIATWYDEQSAYAEAIEKGVPEAEARERFVMDVHNNVLSIRSMMRRKGDFGKVLVDMLGMMDRGPARITVGKGGSSHANDINGPQTATWKNTTENDTFDKKEASRQALQALKRDPGPFVDVGNGPEQAEVTDDRTHPIEEGESGTPQSSRALLEMMLELGLIPKESPDIDTLLSDLPDDYKVKLLTIRTDTPSHLIALQVILAIGDTNQELEGRILEFLYKHLGAGSTGKLMKPQIEDPPKDLRMKDLNRPGKDRN